MPESTPAAEQAGPQTVDEWGIRFWDSSQQRFREVTFSEEFALLYQDDKDVTVIRRTRVVTPDRVSAWTDVEPTAPPGAPRDRAPANYAEQQALLHDSLRDLPPAEATGESDGH